MGGGLSAALAARLSEDSTRNACLIEAGSSGRAYTSRARRHRDGAGSRAQLALQSVPQPAMVAVPAPRARPVVTLINGMVYFRGNQA